LARPTDKKVSAAPAAPATPMKARLLMFISSVI
jgi:hypothetical protein